MEDRIVVGSLIRDLCDRKLMTLKDLSDHSDVSYTHLKRIVAAPKNGEKTGYQPRRRTVMAIAHGLGCTLEDITRPRDLELADR